MIAGGVESMSRAPSVMRKAHSAFSRSARIEGTTMGWRFVNPLMKSIYGVDSMPETAENVARDHCFARGAQDAFALRSQRRASMAIAAGRFVREIVPVSVAQKKGHPAVCATDEHPRPTTTIEQLASLKGIVHPDGAVTVENASGVNDRACGLLFASEHAAQALAVLHDLETPDDAPQVNPNGGAIALGHPPGYVRGTSYRYRASRT